MGKISHPSSPGSVISEQLSRFNLYYVSCCVVLLPEPLRWSAALSRSTYHCRRGGGRASSSAPLDVTGVVEVEHGPIVLHLPLGVDVDYLEGRADFTSCVMPARPGRS